MVQIVLQQVTFKPFPHGAVVCFYSMFQWHDKEAHLCLVAVFLFKTLFSGEWVSIMNRTKRWTSSHPQTVTKELQLTENIWEQSLWVRGGSVCDRQGLGGRWWWGVGEWWLILQSAAAFSCRLLSSSSYSSSSPFSSSSHVGAHPGLTVGWGQLSLTALSGRRLWRGNKGDAFNSLPWKINSLISKCCFKLGLHNLQK